jgi:hypothetical protein
MELLSKLRPVFFRRGENDEVTYSGWVNVHTLDIWAHEDDARAFSNEAGNVHGMVLVRGASLALTVGERITFVLDVDLHPATTIEAGERGVVGRRDKTTGTRRKSSWSSTTSASTMRQTASLCARIATSTAC